MDKGILDEIKKVELEAKSIIEKAQLEKQKIIQDSKLHSIRISDQKEKEFDARKQALLDKKKIEIEKEKSKVIESSKSESGKVAAGAKRNINVAVDFVIEKIFEAV